MMTALLLGIIAFLVARGVLNHQRQKNFAQNIHALEQDTPALLAWMKTDLGLTDDEFARECRIHDEHMVEYRRLCDEMQASRERLKTALQESQNLSDEGQAAAIKDYEDHFEACERAVIQHVKHVAAAMNPKAGQTYLTMMLPHLFPDHENIRLNNEPPTQTP
ncbi:hypothetical protein [Prosthecobacter debontii]|nr:hypothetical protein [Prosthecobacter debontii]